MAKDKLGNELFVGDVVLWKPIRDDLTLSVMEVVDDPADGKKQHIKLVVEINMQDITGRGNYDVYKLLIPKPKTTQ